MTAPWNDLPIPLSKTPRGIAYGVTVAAVSITILTHLGLITARRRVLPFSSPTPRARHSARLLPPQHPLLLVRLSPPRPRLHPQDGALGRPRLPARDARPGWLSFATLNPAFGAILAGLLSGSASSPSFATGQSLGGIGILGLYLQDRTGFRAGHLQLAFDAVLFLAALLILDARTVALTCSVPPAVNLVISFEPSPRLVRRHLIRGHPAAQAESCANSVGRLAVLNTFLAEEPLRPTASIALPRLPQSAIPKQKSPQQSTILGGFWLRR